MMFPELSMVCPERERLIHRLGAAIHIYTDETFTWDYIRTLREHSPEHAAARRARVKALDEIDARRLILNKHEYFHHCVKRSFRVRHRSAIIGKSVLFDQYRLVA
jgi:hypothetical protein